MKKLLLSLVLALVASTAMQAVTLFPFFADIAGVYDEGAADIAAVNGMTTHLTGRSDGGGTKAVRSFLDAVLPQKEVRIVETSENGCKITNISSSFQEGKLISVILLVEKKGRLSIMYFEGPAKNFNGSMKLPK